MTTLGKFKTTTVASILVRKKAETVITLLDLTLCFCLMDGLKKSLIVSTLMEVRNNSEAQKVWIEYLFLTGYQATVTYEGEAQPYEAQGSSYKPVQQSYPKAEEKTDSEEYGQVYYKPLEEAPEPQVYYKPLEAEPKVYYKPIDA